jgi:hypothetical protein
MNERRQSSRNHRDKVKQTTAFRRFRNLFLAAMAAGTQTVYKLDLDDVIAFPDSGHVPAFPPNPGESWIIFGEVLLDSQCPPVNQNLIASRRRSRSFPDRQRLFNYVSGVQGPRQDRLPLSRRVLHPQPFRRREGSQMQSRTYFVHHQRNAARLCGWIEWIQDRGPGHGVCKSTTQRIRPHPPTSWAQVLPCSMKELRALNQRLRKKSDDGEMELCSACKKPSTHRRAKCETSYCSRVTINTDPCVLNWTPFSGLSDCGLETGSSSGMPGYQTTANLESHTLGLIVAFVYHGPDESMLGQVCTGSKIAIMCSTRIVHRHWFTSE